MASPSLCERLGYPPETRLLIVNADDFGMCRAENEATIEGLLAGCYTSSTVMTPCPWFLDAAAHARAHPELDIGVHITHTSEWETYKWGPVSGRSAVPSMVDEHGYLFRDVEPVYGNARLDDIERETRAQIDLALAAGIDVTHLDSHMGTLQLDGGYHALYVRLALEYRLPIRMAGRDLMTAMGMGEVVRQAEEGGVLAPDVLLLGGPPEPQQTEAYWTSVFRNLAPGVTEIYVHAGLDQSELRALCPQWEQRVADHRFFSSPESEERIEGLGIVRIGYRALRDLQRAAA